MGQCYAKNHVYERHKQTKESVRGSNMEHLRGLKIRLWALDLDGS